MDGVRILAYISGTVDQELLPRNEYLAAENRILKSQVKGRLLLSDTDRTTLAEIGHRLGCAALADVANPAKPGTILGGYRRLVACKFDGSKRRRYPGRPRVDGELEQRVVRMAMENRDGGYDRIVSALANLGHSNRPPHRLPSARSSALGEQRIRPRTLTCPVALDEKLLGNDGPGLNAVTWLVRSWPWSHALTGNLGVYRRSTAAMIPAPTRATRPN